MVFPFLELNVSLHPIAATLKSVGAKVQRLPFFDNCARCYISVDAFEEVWGWSRPGVLSNNQCAAHPKHGSWIVSTPQDLL